MVGSRNSVFISTAREKVHGLGETQGDLSPSPSKSPSSLYLLSVMEQLSCLPREVVGVVFKKVG